MTSPVSQVQLPFGARGTTQAEAREFFFVGMIVVAADALGERQLLDTAWVKMRASVNPGECAWAPRDRGARGWPPGRAAARAVLETTTATTSRRTRWRPDRRDPPANGSVSGLFARRGREHGYYGFDVYHDLFGLAEPVVISNPAAPFGNATLPAALVSHRGSTRTTTVSPGVLRGAVRSQRSSTSRSTRPRPGLVLDVLGSHGDPPPVLAFRSPTSRAPSTATLRPRDPARPDDDRGPDIGGPRAAAAIRARRRGGGTLDRLGRQQRRHFRGPRLPTVRRCEDRDVWTFIMLVPLDNWSRSC